MNKINYTSKEIYDKLLKLDKRYSFMAKNNFNKKTLSRYEYECYRGRYFSLLMDEPYINGNEEEAANLLYYSASLMYRTLVEELSNKQIDENIKMINQIISKKITRNDFNDVPSVIEAYDNTVFVLLNLRHENIEPLHLFQRFINDYCIKIRSGGKKAKFKAKFLEETISNKTKKWIYFDNFYDFLLICEQYISNTVRTNVCDYITQGSLLIPSLMPVNFDMDELKSISHLKEFYDYLVPFDGIKANIKLDNLYLLTHFEEMSVFKDDDIMNKILERIEYNLKSKEYKEINGDYLPYSIFDFSD